VTPTRRTFAFVQSTIVTIVALLVSSFAVTLTGGLHATRATTQAPAATIADAHARASEPDGSARAAFLRARAPQIGQIHARQQSGGDGAHNIASTNAAPASIDLLALRAPGAAVDARRDGVTSPGQPAPSSRAPPIA